MSSCSWQQLSSAPHPTGPDVFLRFQTAWPGWPRARRPPVQSPPCAQGTSQSTDKKQITSGAMPSASITDPFSITADRGEEKDVSRVGSPDPVYSYVHRVHSFPKRYNSALVKSQKEGSRRLHRGRYDDQSRPSVPASFDSQRGTISFVKKGCSRNWGE
jgi:hypothetical protein